MTGLCGLLGHKTRPAGAPRRHGYLGHLAVVLPQDSSTGRLAPAEETIEPSLWAAPLDARPTAGSGMVTVTMPALYPIEATTGISVPSPKGPIAAVGSNTGPSIAGAARGGISELTPTPHRPLGGRGAGLAIGTTPPGMVLRAMTPQRNVHTLTPGPTEPSSGDRRFLHHASRSARDMARTATEVRAQPAWSVR